MLLARLDTRLTVIKVRQWPDWLPSLPPVPTSCRSLALGRSDAWQDWRCPRFPGSDVPRYRSLAVRQDGRGTSPMPPDVVKLPAGRNLGAVSFYDAVGNTDPGLTVQGAMKSISARQDKTWRPPTITGLA
jgi:hypothetical protein